MESSFTFEIVAYDSSFSVTFRVNPSTPMKKVLYSLKQRQGITNVFMYIDGVYIDNESIYIHNCTCEILNGAKSVQVAYY